MSETTDAEGLEVRLLLEAIHAQYGYDLRGYAPASMRRRVLAAMAKGGLANLGELQHAIIHDPDAFANVFEELTVRVSELFRDPPFYLAIRQRVVPLLQTYPLLRIWHAGCASGEEVYATAIVLRECGLYDRAQIYATDLSPLALEHAKQGVYPSAQAAAVGERYAQSGGRDDVASNYTEAYDHVAMHETLRRNVLFFRHDLVVDHAFGEMHVLFCRNVLIYFGEELRRRVLAKFAASLCPGGFLCLGAAERLSPTLDPRFKEFARDERIYRFEP